MLICLFLRHRKTGVFLKDTGLRDEHGMQPLDDIFSSPEKESRSGAEGEEEEEEEEEDSDEEPMDIDESTCEQEIGLPGLQNLQCMSADQSTPQ